MASDGLTEREKVLLRREGYVAARKHVCPIYSSAECESWEELAARMFPLPKVTRRRELDAGNGRRYRVGPLGLEFQATGSDWWEQSTQSRATLYALLDLLDNPDEGIPE